MDLNEIEKILGEAGIHSCEICGTPYTPRHKRQRTCGAPECKAEHHRRWLREYNRRKKEEDPDAFRKYHTIKTREYRARLKEREKRDRQLEGLQERWQKQKEFDKKVTEYGHEYGKRSAEKVLESVSKIDVNMGKEQDDDRVQSADEQRRGE